MIMMMTDYHDDLQVIGHPCCIGIRGQCQITTKEFCDFVQGVFHDEAALCSQVLFALFKDHWQYASPTLLASRNNAHTTPTRCRA